MSEKCIYHFGNEISEGRADMVSILGSKGAHLCEMSNLGLPVPKGFIIPTGYCFVSRAPIKDKIRDAVLFLEKSTGKTFGCKYNPLLLSVRSGSKVSMPGMLDTVLNIGLNDDIVHHINTSFIYDNYRRLLSVYGHSVLEIDSFHFEAALHDHKIKYGVDTESEFSLDCIKSLAESYKQIINKTSRSMFVQNCYEQLYLAIEAVFSSWESDRAIAYRNMNNIPEELGTAVVIQSMVFGNLNSNSGSGVVFTRNPNTGKKEMLGEYMMCAQGEDIVSGTHTPSDISIMQLKLPSIYNSLLIMCQALERHYQDMQDIEFTVEDGKLWLLQTRSGKRSSRAKIRILMDMLDEQVISKDDVVSGISSSDFKQILHPTMELNGDANIIASGLPASPGVVVGKVVFSVKEALKATSEGEKVVLIRNETSPEDINGMRVAEAIVTARGGMTSHAAVVARGIGKVCICGLVDVTIDLDHGMLTTTNNLVVKAGDMVTVDGTNGNLILGNSGVLIKDSCENQYLGRIIQCLHERETIAVYANADTPQDAELSLQFGASGIGLCRTEHMFFEQDRINLVRRMIILSDDDSDTLQKLEECQVNDFMSIFTVFASKPVTIRLLDPPLHEFLPKTVESLSQFSIDSGIYIEIVKKYIESVREDNPMLGHRGCRLGISYPKIYKMQMRAILRAAHIVQKALNIPIVPEIMVPFAIKPQELLIIKRMLYEESINYPEVHYKFGAMIELPSAALLAGGFSRLCDFISFGTNDLTQTTLGLSRDDSSKFMSKYSSHGIFEHDPFVVLDRSVKELIRLSVSRSIAANEDIKLGVCGEHAVSSLDFFSELNFKYVSCSPRNIPIAKLASAVRGIRQDA